MLKYLIVKFWNENNDKSNEIFSRNLTKGKDQLQVRLLGLNGKVVKLESLDKHKDKILRKYEQSI